MNSITALICCIGAIAIGFCYGVVARRLTYWRRIGLYVKNDDVRFSANCLGVTLILISYGEIRSKLIYGYFLKDGIYPWCIGTSLCYGVKLGFAFERRVLKQIDTPYTEEDL